MCHGRIARAVLWAWGNWDRNLRNSTCSTEIRKVPNGCGTRYRMIPAKINQKDARADHWLLVPTSIPLFVCTLEERHSPNFSSWLVLSHDVSGLKFSAPSSCSKPNFTAFRLRSHVILHDLAMFACAWHEVLVRAANDWDCVRKSIAFAIWGQASLSFCFQVRASFRAGI